MATIWLIEESHTVRRMVEISLSKLPIEITHSDQVAELIQAGSPCPDLVITAEKITQVTDPSRGYLAQAWQLANVGYRCPLIVLTQQRSAPITADQLEGRLPFLGSLKKPFKTQALIDLVCQGLDLPVPHPELFKEQSRSIPLARRPSPSADQPTVSTTPALSTRPVETPKPTSVGSIFGAMTPAQSEAPLSTSLSPTPSQSAQTINRDSTPHPDATASLPPHLESPSGAHTPLPSSSRQPASLAVPPPLITSHHQPEEERDTELQISPISSLSTTDQSSPSDGDVASTLQETQVSTSVSNISHTSEPASIGESHHIGDPATPIDELGEDALLTQQSNHPNTTPVPLISPPLDASLSPLPQPPALKDEDGLEDWMTSDQALHNETPSDLPSSSDSVEKIANEVLHSSTEDQVKNGHHETQSPHPGEAFSNDLMLELVRSTTDEALRIVERATQRHASPLTSNEMRTLVERIAWEVIPTATTNFLHEYLISSSDADHP